MAEDAELNPAAVEVGRFFPQSPEEVWRALTDPDLLEQWLLRSVGFTPEVGTHFMFVMPTEPPSEIVSEVLVARPGEQLTYTWVYTKGDNPPKWVVDWTIEAQGRGTRLLLTQTGFDIEDRRQKMARNAMERGWRNLMPKLEALLAR
ncbi:SRPBCC domain-containing protein [Nocardia sp. NPDC058058]|uniref:SRPBCC family protein n=1 Tax=Nocardia sp. NPDC058058 TaxID=3346317 RepID=UPI0036D9AEDF